MIFVPLQRQKDRVEISLKEPTHNLQLLGPWHEPVDVDGVNADGGAPALRREGHSWAGLHLPDGAQPVENILNKIDKF